MLANVERPRICNEAVCSYEVVVIDTVCPSSSAPHRRMFQGFFSYQLFYCFSEESARTAARRFARALQKLGFKARFSHFRVVNVLGTCTMPFGIHITKFSQEHRQAARSVVFTSKPKGGVCKISNQYFLFISAFQLRTRVASRCHVQNQDSQSYAEDIFYRKLNHNRFGSITLAILGKVGLVRKVRRGDGLLPRQHVYTLIYSTNALHI